jgi:hypothetical protein
MLRIVYEVDISTNPEVSMSKLRAPNERPTKVTKVKKNATSSKVDIKSDDMVEPQEEEGQLAEHSEHSMDNDNDDDEISQPSSPKFAKTSQGGRKFDLISSLEQKYGGGAHYGDEEEDEDESSRGSGSTGRSAGQIKKRKKKRNVDDEW